MTIDFKGLNMELTDAIKARVQEKMDGLAKLTAGFDQVANAQVEVGKTSHHHNKGQVFRCEINLRAPGGELRAEEEREDLYEAIDVAVGEMKRLLVERKERLDERGNGPRPGKE